MKERLITLACAIGALALFYAFFAPKRDLDAPDFSRPTSVEHRDNGYLGAVTWLQRAGVRVVGLRRRFDDMDRLGLPEKGNLLVTTLPYRFDLRDREIEPLLEWVSAGNTLLIMAALGDTPEWAFGIDYGMDDTLESLSEVRFLGNDPVEDAKLEARLKEQAREKESGSKKGEKKKQADKEALPENDPAKAVDLYGRLRQPLRFKIVPNGAHPLLAGVGDYLAETEHPAYPHWRAIASHAFAFALAHQDPTGSEALWIRRYGSGSMIVSAYASPFTNQLIGERDNGRLLANVVAYALRGKGAVVFDDTHQGLTELYDPQAFFGDARLHSSIWLLLALWFIWVLGMTRLRPAAQPARAPRESALVVAVGGYLARVLRPAEAGRRMCELFFNDVHRRLGRQEDGTPAWEWLERQPQVPAAEVAQLREFHERLAAGARIDLQRLNDLTVRLQERLP